MNPQQLSTADIQTRLIAHAATDADFRQELLAHGREAIEHDLGVRLPPDLEIQVIEETPNRLCLVLPMKQEPQHALSDAELDKVSGGNLPGPLPMPVADLPGPMPTPAFGFERLNRFRLR